jgi:hypothetical protein
MVSGRRPPAGVDAATILTRFMPQGALARMPTKATKRTVVLEHVANLFEPGVRYPETRVDELIRGVLVSPEAGGEVDHVTVRRALVDHQLLDREAGEYWRTGGWVAGT